MFQTRRQCIISFWETNMCMRKLLNLSRMYDPDFRAWILVMTHSFQSDLALIWTRASCYARCAHSMVHKPIVILYPGRTWRSSPQATTKDAKPCLFNKERPRNASPISWHLRAGERTMVLTHRPLLRILPFLALRNHLQSGWMVSTRNKYAHVAVTRRARTYWPRGDWLLFQRSISGRL